MNTHRAAVLSLVMFVVSGVVLSAAVAEPRLGLAANYPGDIGIKSHPDVFLFSDFEQSGWINDWSYMSGTLRTVASDSARRFEPLSGSALRVTIPKGKNMGMDGAYLFAGKAGYEPEEAYFRYYLRIGDDWRPSHNGKMPGLAGTYNSGGWGGRYANGTNGWSARGTYRPTDSSGTIPQGSYVYHADMSSWGTVWLWGEKGRLRKNRWYCVEQYVKMNTPGQRDGIIRAWIDGELAFDKRNIRFRDVSRIKIDRVWMNVYHGGSLTAPTDLTIYIDNVVVAKSYIGPMVTGLQPPAPPRLLEVR